MTNADKLLKDGVSGIKPLLDKCREIGAIDSGREYRIDQMLREQAKPTLTEDERVILRNIDKNYDKIGRKLGGALYLRFAPQEYGDKGDIDSTFEDFFGDHLFQFIKERRRIQHTRIIKGGIKQ